MRSWGRSVESVEVGKWLRQWPRWQQVSDRQKGGGRKQADLCKWTDGQTNTFKTETKLLCLAVSDVCCTSCTCVCFCADLNFSTSMCKLHHWHESYFDPLQQICWTSKWKDIMHQRKRSKYLTNEDTKEAVGNQGAIRVIGMHLADSAIILCFRSILCHLELQWPQRLVGFWHRLQCVKRGVEKRGRGQQSLQGVLPLSVCISQMCLGSACPLANTNKCQRVLLIILLLFWCRLGEPNSDGWVQTSEFNERALPAIPRQTHAHTHTPPCGSLNEPREMH